MSTGAQTVYDRDVECVASGCLDPGTSLDANVERRYHVTWAALSTCRLSRLGGPWAGPGLAGSRRYWHVFMLDVAGSGPARGGGRV